MYRNWFTAIWNLSFLQCWVGGPPCAFNEAAETCGVGMDIEPGGEGGVGIRSFGSFLAVAESYYLLHSENLSLPTPAHLKFTDFASSVSQKGQKKVNSQIKTQDSYYHSFFKRSDSVNFKANRIMRTCFVWVWSFELACVWVRLHIPNENHWIFGSVKFDFQVAMHSFIHWRWETP